MAFLVQDLHDLIGLLEQHPEWRAEIRRLVLTEELLSLPQVVRDLGEAQRRTEQRVEELAEAQRRTEQRVSRLQNDVGEFKGIVFEERYHRRAPSYFFRLIRCSRVISGNELASLLETAVVQDILSEEAAEDIIWADMVVRGQQRDDGAEVYLVVEISWGIGSSDVERAVRRVALLAQIGVRTLPVVAGDHIIEEAAELCRAMHVWQVLEGRLVPPTSC